LEDTAAVLRDIEKDLSSFPDGSIVTASVAATEKLTSDMYAARAAQDALRAGLDGQRKDIEVLNRRVTDVGNEVVTLRREHKEKASASAGEMAGIQTATEVLARRVDAISKTISDQQQAIAHAASDARTAMQDAHIASLGPASGDASSATVDAACDRAIESFARRLSADLGGSPAALGAEFSRVLVQLSAVTSKADTDAIVCAETADRAHALAVAAGTAVDGLRATVDTLRHLVTTAPPPTSPPGSAGDLASRVAALEATVDELQRRTVDTQERLRSDILSVRTDIQAHAAGVARLATRLDALENARTAPGASPSSAAVVAMSSRLSSAENMAAQALAAARAAEDGALEVARMFPQFQDEVTSLFREPSVSLSPASPVPAQPAQQAVAPSGPVLGVSSAAVASSLPAGLAASAASAFPATALGSPDGLAGGTMSLLPAPSAPVKAGLQDRDKEAALKEVRERLRPCGTATPAGTDLVRQIICREDWYAKECAKSTAELQQSVVSAFALLRGVHRLPSTNRAGVAELFTLEFLFHAQVERDTRAALLILSERLRHHLAVVAPSTDSFGTDATILAQ
jgi:hypothetical protein